MAGNPLVHAQHKGRGSPLGSASNRTGSKTCGLLLVAQANAVRCTRAALVDVATTAPVELTTGFATAQDLLGTETVVSQWIRKYQIRLLRHPGRLFIGLRWPYSRLLRSPQGAKVPAWTVRATHTRRTLGRPRGTSRVARRK